MNLDERISFITNQKNRSFYHELKEAFSICNRFYLSVAFIHSSALGLFSEELNKFELNGKQGQIITTDYMNGTDPNALDYLIKFKSIDTRIFKVDQNGHKGFHTKAYIFEMKDYYKIYVGSSNLTSSALKTNQEWNVAILFKDEDVLHHIFAEYNRLWSISDTVDNEFITQYKKEYYKNKDFSEKQIFDKIINFIRQSESYQFISELASFLEIDENNLKIRLAEESIREIKPNNMQEEACERLHEFRKNGEDKALVISATGTGKTYLAAFDVSQFNPKKVLFVVHREKILKDAERTFKTVMPEAYTGILTGNVKDFDADYLFASNTMMGREDIYSQYSPEYFDYIVIDEAHRSAADTYQNIINYFKPKFLLGMTATPERTDNLNIYSFFDHNVAVEIRLRDALEKSLVVPFQYYGIDDISTDLQGINLTDIDLLAKKLSINKRVELIIEHMNLYPFNGKKRRALGFCISKAHAIYMAKEFNARGYHSIALLGDNSETEREIAINRISDDEDELSFIFTVDIFNEGIDIPSINLILMLRPTESPIIFTQQLGRGLRKFEYKEYLTVLDFIGNYSKAFMIPIALSGSKAHDKDDLIESTKNDFFDIPGDVFIRLEKQAKERILKQLETTNFNTLKYLKESYQSMFNEKKEMKKELKYIPLTMYEQNEFDVIRFIKYDGTYVRFINRMTKGELFGNILINTNKMKMIKFVDDLLPIKNPLVYISLLKIISNDLTTIDEVLAESKKYTEHLTKSDAEYAFEYLAGKYFAPNYSIKYANWGKYQEKTFILSPENRILINEDSNFKQLINESLEYGLSQYYYEFNQAIIEHGFKYYHPYSMREVAQIIKYDKSLSSFRGQGVFFYKNYYSFFLLPARRVLLTFV